MGRGQDVGGGTPEAPSGGASRVPHVWLTGKGRIASKALPVGTKRQAQPPLALCRQEQAN